MNDTGLAMLFVCGLPLSLAAILALVVWLWNRDRLKLATIRAERDRLAAELPPLRRQNADYQRHIWLTTTLPALTYRNEIEVELKFIGPLLQHLGFSPSQVDLRVPVSVQVGRQGHNGSADWIVWEPDHTRPLVVIEAKRPKESLNGTAQGQARSYAFALGAPMFLLTNGSRLQIYRRGVQSDQLTVNCTVEEMVEQWPNIVEALNPKG